MRVDVDLPDVFEELFVKVDLSIAAANITFR